MNKNTLKIIISIIILLLITIGASFAYFTANISGEETATTITVTGGTMNIVYNGGATINLTSISPQIDKVTTKTFTVTGNNTTGLEMKYNISLIIETNTFSNGAIQYKLISTNTNGNGSTIPSKTIMMDIATGSSTILLGNGSFTGPTDGNKVHTYNLELYFPESNQDQNINQGKNFSGYVQIKEGLGIIAGYNEIKRVNKPVLFTGMIPVKWDDSYNEIITTENDPNWYDYNTKKWANAKTVDGSYWVWIPKYAYKITSGYNSSTTGTIDIKFLKGTTYETNLETRIETNEYKVGVKATSINYFLHPSFQFNGDELGFWVAKFEPTAAEGVVSGTDVCNPADNVTTKTIKIEPNTTSWRCINISNAYNVSLNMKDKTAVYGWNPSEVDTHMMKNIEWGAVAYLSKSQYGADTEVWNNSFNLYRTGYSGSGVNALNEDTCITYKTENGQKASTTHNIYGVYDMSGGSWERVMGNYNNLGGSSGFTSLQVEAIDLKYITKYRTQDKDLLNEVGMNYDLITYGDAIFETSSNAYRYNGSEWSGSGAGSWYGDNSYLPYISAPWFYRGGHFLNGDSSGIFYFSQSNGNANVYFSFRPVVFAVA